MKKLLAVLMVLCLALASSVFAEAADVFDAGRISVPVPDGWTATAVSDTSMMLSKGILFVDPMATFSFFPAGFMFLDSKELYENVEDLEPFTAGGYNWTGYRGSSMGMGFTNLLAESEAGVLYCSILRTDGFDETDPDVQAMLAGVSVVPSVTADWFSVSDDGLLTVTLAEPEGFTWQDGGLGYSGTGDDSSEHDYEMNHSSENGTFTLTLRDRTDGWITIYLSLSNDTSSAGEATLSAIVSGGKITYVSQAELNLYEEPRVFDTGDLTPATGEDFIGSWEDETSQRASLEISQLEDEQYQILVSWSSSATENTEWRMTGRINNVNDLEYMDGSKVNLTYDDDGNVVNEETVYSDAEGWFSLSEGKLRWIDFKEEAASDCSFVRAE